MIIPAGSESAFYLFVKANFNAEPGKKAFSADLATDDGQKQILSFEADVEEAARKEFTFFDRLNLQMVLILLIVIILIIGIIFGMKNYMKKTQ
jgi:hypothetical protein